MAVLSSKTSLSLFGASAFELAQKWHVVLIGFKVGALDALRLKERFATRYMSLGTIDGGCGLHISADLVFQQNQPQCPLARARRENAPMS
jgi:hypothetical protein